MQNNVTVIFHRGDLRRAIPMPEALPLREYRFFPGDPDPWMVTGIEFPRLSSGGSLAA